MKTSRISPAHDVTSAQVGPPYFASPAARLLPRAPDPKLSIRRADLLLRTGKDLALAEVEVVKAELALRAAYVKVMSLLGKQ